MKRRDFLKTAGIFAAGIGPVGLSFKNKINDHLNGGNGIFIGAPVLPEYLYENGISETLDTMQKLAGIQTVMTFSHDFNFRMYTPNAEPKKDREGTPLTNIYVRTNPNFYVNSAFADRDSTTKYSDRDILDELHEESAVRGMNVYARILEPYKINGAIPGFEFFAEVDADGNEGQNVCFNHPEYQA
jgi:hypothetical protein